MTEMERVAINAGMDDCTQAQEIYQGVCEQQLAILELLKEIKLYSILASERIRTALVRNEDVMRRNHEIFRR